MTTATFSPDTPTANLQNLSFYQVCLELLQPCTSLLADSCRLSISQIRQALPSMVKAVIYQSLVFIQTHGQAKFISEILQAQSLAPLALKEKFGLNFTQLERLKPEFLPFRQRLFAENGEEKSENFAWLIGLLVEKTGLTVTQVIALFDKVALLTVKLLADIRTLATTSASQTVTKQLLTEKQFFNWLNLQPMLMASLDDKGLINILGYQSQTTLGQSLKEQTTFYKNNSLTPELTALATLICHYKNTQPLGIIPNEFLAKPKRLASPTALMPNTPSIFIAEKSLATAKNPTWQQSLQKTLQRHWMVTAGVLTAVVFGGIALITPQKEKPKTPITAQQVEEMPHDVAIIKVDSSSEVTEKSAESTVSSVSVTKTTSSTTKTAIQPNNKSANPSDTKSDTKTTTNKDSSKDKEKPKDKPKSDKKDDSKKSTKTEKSSKDSKLTKDTKKSNDKPKDSPKKSDTVKKATVTA